MTFSRTPTVEFPAPVAQTHGDTVPTQRMRLSRPHSEASSGLQAVAVFTARTEVPAVVALQACGLPMELEWHLSAFHARQLADQLFKAAHTCTQVDAARQFPLRSVKGL
jgi:hypothetical protein